MLSQEEKLKAINKLNEIIPKMSCPMCRTPNFVLADGYFNNTLQSQFNGLAIGGTSIPTVAIICENCGFVSQHALGAIGLLPTAIHGKYESRQGQ